MVVVAVGASTSVKESRSLSGSLTSDVETVEGVGLLPLLELLVIEAEVVVLTKLALEDGI